MNNAGYGSYGALEDVPIAEARRQFEVNVFALARLTQLVLPHMRAQRDGYIVNISSMGGKFGEPLGGWYHAAKFAVEGLSDCLRAEVAEFGIKVVVIEPGSITSEWATISADNLEAMSADTPYRAGEIVARGLRASETSFRRRNLRSSRRRSAKLSSERSRVRVTPSAAGRAFSCRPSGC